MKTLFIAIFSLVLFGCAEVSYPTYVSDSVQENNSIENNSIDNSNCKLEVVDILPAHSSYSSPEIVFNNTSGSYKTASYYLSCGTYRDYNDWSYIDTGRNKKTIYGSTYCKGDDICVEIEPVAGCGRRKYCLSQFN
ncbi:MAG: hypothetical protein MJZ34_10505 [Paludibacteraceae bacterium]|nr:hypothetical protein [Paludibacteraceae bacterium]